MRGYWGESGGGEMEELLPSRRRTGGAGLVEKRIIKEESRGEDKKKERSEIERMRACPRYKAWEVVIERAEGQRHQPGRMTDEGEGEKKKEDED